MTLDEIPLAWRNPLVHLSERVEGYAPNITVTQCTSGRKMLYVGRDDNKAIFIAWAPDKESINRFDCPLDQILERDTERLQLCELVENYGSTEKDYEKYIEPLSKALPDHVS